MRTGSGFIRGVMVGGAALGGAGTAHAVPGDPWADAVLGYAAGAGANPSFLNPSTTLGSPESATAGGDIVTMFNPAFGTDELGSIGTGGRLDVQFDAPVVDDPANPFGVDLIIFGNAGFVDFDPGDGAIDGPGAAFGSIFGTDPMDVSVSQNGVDWFSVGTFTEGLFPAQAFTDVPPFGDVPGLSPTDFTKPVDPALTLADFENLSYADALNLYAGSGGGTPIDISPSGLASASFVRVENPRTGVTVEIEAFAAVPEPQSMFLVCMGLFFAVSLRRES
jgi:hypothetical protein